MKGCKSTYCLSGHTDLTGSTTSTVCCWDWEAELLVKSTCTVRAAQCCRRMKPSVVPVPALATKQLKKFWEENCHGSPAAPQSLLVWLQAGLPTVPQEHVHCHHLQAGVHPAFWPPGLRQEIRIAFRFNGKGLWYLQHLKLALQNLSKSACFSL